MSNTGRWSRRKGHNFERAIASMLRTVFPEAKRGFQYDNPFHPDVGGTPFWIECKVGKKPNIVAAMEQAVNDSDGRDPVVITKRDNEDILVTMRFEDWLKWIETRISIVGMPEE